MFQSSSLSEFIFTLKTTETTLVCPKLKKPLVAILVQKVGKKSLVTICSVKIFKKLFFVTICSVKTIKTNWGEHLV
jgi:hypothetical protein